MQKLVGAAKRYIAGRNAVQTVYWRGPTDNNQSVQQKFMKVARTVRFDKSQTTVPERIKQEQITRF